MLISEKRLTQLARAMSYGRKTAARLNLNIEMQYDPSLNIIYFNLDSKQVARMYIFDTNTANDIRDQLITTIEHLTPQD